MRVFVGAGDTLVLCGSMLMSAFADVGCSVCLSCMYLCVCVYLSVGVKADEF